MEFVMQSHRKIGEAFTDSPYTFSLFISLSLHPSLSSYLSLSLSHHISLSFHYLSYSFFSPSILLALSLSYDRSRSAHTFVDLCTCDFRVLSLSLSLWKALKDTGLAVYCAPKSCKSRGDREWDSTHGSLCALHVVHAV